MQALLPRPGEDGGKQQQTAYLQEKLQIPTGSFG
jgi:hypothetical protein